MNDVKFVCDPVSCSLICGMWSVSKGAVCACRSMEETLSDQLVGCLKVVPFYCWVSNSECLYERDGARYASL